MSKKLQLSIPKPCHENWDNMTPVQQGKFCGSCQKQVVDFSNMSDRQVAEFFKKPSTGSVCGRFMTEQLDRNIEIPKKRIPWLKYFFQFAIPAFLVSIKGSAQKTQGTVAFVRPAKDTTKIPKYTPLMGKVSRPVCTPLMGDVLYVPEKITKLNGAIQLKVVDEKGNAISYASIETGVIGKGGATDKNGLFKLDMSLLNINGEIFVSSAGYERKEVPVKSISNAGETVTIVLQEKGWLNKLVTTTSCVLRHTVTLGMISRVDPSQLIDKNVINGIVVDEQGKAIPYASVVIKGAKTGIMTNANGSFSITPGAGWTDITLVGSSAGFDVTELSVRKKNTSDSVIIQLKPAIFVGGVVVVSRKPAKKEIKNVPLMPAIIDDKHTAAFKVFPNPVESGSNMNIEIKKLEEGYYDLQLLDLSGQPVHQQEIWIDTEARLLNIDVPHVAAGSYFLTLTNKKSSKKITGKIIIQ
jgi:hypothetical protein